MFRFLILFFFLFLFFSCDKQKEKIAIKTIKKQEDNSKKTIASRFLPPKGYFRTKLKPNSFENYLRNFKLKANNSKVHLYNGSLKHRQDIHAGVLDIDVGKRDLQQCADATIRLRAEYLYLTKQYDKIHFNFTNGFKASYKKWRKGYRISVKQNYVKWYKTNKESLSYTSFKEYLQIVFIYAGTLSLEKELSSISLKNIQIGDIFIQGGSPGHAIIVVDLAENNKGELMMLLAQSYMPAQEIHILKNLNKKEISPWYSLANLEVLKTPEWIFLKTDLKRFSSK